MNKYLIFVIVLIIALSSCTSATLVGQVSEQEIPMPNGPEAGLATVTGKVISESTNEPLSEVIVRLAEVFRPPEEQGEPVYVLDQAFSPGAKTDQNGIFLFENVEAMEYVIIVGDVERTYEVIAGEDKKPTVWIALPDEILNAGVLVVSLTEADR